MRVVKLIFSISVVVFHCLIWDWSHLVSLQPTHTATMLLSGERKAHSLCSSSRCPATIAANTRVESHFHTSILICGQELSQSIRSG